ncbi:MAG: hypothetical protein M3463_09925 [Verrucomicrobiota bacterium]|nr:hypothetical protein [Verrucomicrobiota bacterium]
MGKAVEVSALLFALCALTLRLMPGTLNNTGLERVKGIEPSYRQYIEEFVESIGPQADLPLPSVSPRDVRTFRDALARAGHSPVTVNGALKILACRSMQRSALAISRLIPVRQ